MRDLFEKIYKDKGPLGKWARRLFCVSKIGRSDFQPYEIPRERCHHLEYQ